ncbi:MAG: BrnT family toxin [Shinella sp.]|jgi:uncharacterized protein|nr:BrnT family toxin [Shinella sp.]
MKIVYDESKRRSNIAKHGYDFADLTLEFFAGSSVAAAKKNRMKAIGPFRGQTLSVVFFRLGSEGLALISMRPASRKETLLYAEYQKQTGHN